MKQKTKSLSLITIFNDPEYIRKPQNFITIHDILTVRAIIMGRYGMLQCAANYGTGYGGKDCKICKEVDNESHRINNCSLGKDELV